MANYKSAIARVLLTEGGYANDPDDSGGETYRGISRVNWPKWSGWATVDKMKAQPNFPRNLKGNVTLDIYVTLFYKTNFWDPIGGDQINDQAIADLIVDSAVNEGIKPAIRRAQLIVGLPATGVIDHLLIEKLNSL
ncbi:MAG TPA: glycosyl hydrolase 108 family protein [Paludibacter sp.]